MPKPPDSPDGCEECSYCREPLDSWFENEPVTITTSISSLEGTQDKAMAVLSRLCDSVEAEAREDGDA